MHSLWKLYPAISLSVMGAFLFVPGPWYLIAAGVFAHATGIVVEAVMTKVMHSTAFPSPADVFWLALYPALIAGIAMIIRRRSGRGDWAALVDATTTITTGPGLLCWVWKHRRPRLPGSVRGCSLCSPPRR